MTTIRISTTGEPLTSEQKAHLADRVTEAFAQVEVGNDSPRIRRGFLVQFESLADDDLWLGRDQASVLSPSNRAALVTVRVMAGPWNAAMKADLFDRIEKILREVAEMPRGDDGSDIWMTFVEVPEGGWGLGGRAVAISSIAPVFSKDRQERIRTYLEQRD